MSEVHDKGISGDPVVDDLRAAVSRMETALARERVKNERLQEQNRQLGKDLPAMHADLQRLLKTLGLRHGARPESPHVCMTEAIEAVEALMRDGARFQTAHYLGSDGRPRHEHIDLAPSETTKEQE